MTQKQAQKLYDTIAQQKYITESQILTVKHRLNKGMYVGNLDLHLPITAEQTKKGLDWLWKLYKTPSLKIRKRNPFNARHIAILENFSHFELCSYVNRGNYWVDAYLPVYRVVSKHGRYFDYVAYRNGNKPIEFICEGTY